MPSRQERRRAERDAAKRAPGQAGAAAAAAAAGTAQSAAAGESGGGWATQAEEATALFLSLDFDVVKQMADAGDRQRLTLVHFSAQLEPCLTQENTQHTLNPS